MNRATRLIELLTLLSGRRAYKVDELAVRFELTERTIYRDLSELSRRYPVVRGEHGWRLMDGAKLGALHLNTRERALLQLALSNEALRRQPAVAAVRDSVVAKLEHLNALADEGGSALLAGPERTGDVPPQVVDALDQAVRERRTLEITYTSLTTPGSRTRRLDPYGVFHREGVWYSSGHCHVNDELRIFRLDRIIAARCTEERFEAKEFDLEEDLSHSWNIYRGHELHNIRLHVPADLAPLVRNGALHEGAEVVELDPIGLGAVEYRLRLSHLEEVARWVVGFGGRIRVVAPPKLRLRVRQVAQGALRATTEPDRPSHAEPRSANPTACSGGFE